MTATAFHHEALLYSGEAGSVAGTKPFLERAVNAGEPALAALSSRKAGLLREALGSAAEHVRFVDMRLVGVNPSAIISVWREFVDESRAPGRRVWGIGEPVWPERTSAELAECHRHECLLNLAFADTPGFRLLCPYDTDTLDRAVVDRALMSHPVTLRNGVERASRRYLHPNGFHELLREPLPEPAAATRQISFNEDGLPEVREFVRVAAVDAGLAGDDTDCAVLAVSELASNSAQHGGGRGRCRAWSESDALVYEVEDSGRIRDPMVGRVRPGSDTRGGYGLWIVNQLCELVQVRSSSSGTVVRVHKRRS